MSSFIPPPTEVFHLFHLRLLVEVGIKFMLDVGIGCWYGIRFGKIIEDILVLGGG